MPVKVLNLGEKRHVESLFTNGKSSHLLRDVIDSIIYHQSTKNRLKGFSSYFENNRIRNSVPWL